MGAQRIRGYCPLCISRCGSLSVVEDGRLVAVEPDPEHPTGNALCVKGRAAPELVYSPARLLTPLRRTRPKGEPDPGWEPVSWDEALDGIAERLRTMSTATGPESVAFGVTTPSGTAIADAFGWIHRLARAYGSPNVMFATENCNWHKDFATTYTFGSGIGTPDFERSGCILFWGFNPAVTWPAYAHAALQAKRRGARLVVVDPRRAGLAAHADQWLPVRPGADGILALGLAGVMITRGWYDEAFIRDWTNAPFLVREDGRLLNAADLAPDGSPTQRVVWDEAAERPVCYDPARGGFTSAVERPALFGRFRIETPHGRITCQPVFALFAELCAAYPPERVASESGVPAGQVVETARLLHAHRPVTYFHWTGVSQQADATQIGRAIGLLYALTGSLDSPGGNVFFARPSLNDISGAELLAPAQRPKTLGRDVRPVGPPARGWITTLDLFRAATTGRPYPVRGLVNFGTNFLLSKPHADGMGEMLAGLDLFVHADMFITPTAREADYLLPVASPWERPGLLGGFQLGEAGEALLQWRPAVVQPRGESRSDTWIVFELARRLGLGGHFFGGDMEAALRHVLAPTGLEPAALRASPGGIPAAGPTRYRKYQEQGFATPSRRIEIYSEVLFQAGIDPLPRCTPPPSSSPGRPLTLTSAKWPQFCHSQHRGLPSLRRRMPEPLVLMHPDTAAARGIAAGGWVVVQTPVARLRARARLDAAMRADVVCAQYGWWEACPQLNLPGYPLDGMDNHSYNAALSAGHFDPVSGSNALRGIACEVWPDNKDDG